ncbi:hypothetical protein GCM10023220_23300 [Streptomyces ziwulingensis]|uniref:Uncharacterized protein n=1 Tax=Streptomyces ziwulingensis TaxID=1045501 RepID=A0ABP9BLG7_9ACTN
MPPWSMGSGAPSASFVKVKQYKQRSSVTILGDSWQNSTDTNPWVPHWMSFVAAASLGCSDSSSSYRQSE